MLVLGIESSCDETAAAIVGIIFGCNTIVSLCEIGTEYKDEEWE